MTQQQTPGSKPVIKGLAETPDATLDELRSGVEAEKAARASAVRGASARSSQRGEQRLVRQHISDDRYHIPPELVPDGMSYEWKRYRYGGLVDTDHMRKMMLQHWTAVPRERHQSMVFGESTSQYIEKDGLILMERPRYLTEEAHEERILDARKNYRDNQERMEQDGGRRGLIDGLKPRVSTGYDLEVPEDAE